MAEYRIFTSVRSVGFSRTSSPAAQKTAPIASARRARRRASTTLRHAPAARDTPCRVSRCAALAASRAVRMAPPIDSRRSCRARARPSGPSRARRPARGCSPRSTTAAACSTESRHAEPGVGRHLVEMCAAHQRVQMIRLAQLFDGQIREPQPFDRRRGAGDQLAAAGASSDCWRTCVYTNSDPPGASTRAISASVTRSPSGDRCSSTSIV